MATVAEILNSNIANGVGKRGEWTQSLVKLDNGQEARIFNPIAVGAEVEQYTTESNGKTYTNWRPVKVETPKSTNDQIASNELLDLVKENNKALKWLVKRFSETTQAEVTKDLDAPIDDEEPLWE